MRLKKQGMLFEVFPGSLVSKMPGGGYGLAIFAGHGRYNMVTMINKFHPIIMC